MLLGPYTWQDGKGLFFVETGPFIYFPQLDRPANHTLRLSLLFSLNDAYYKGLRDGRRQADMDAMRDFEKAQALQSIARTLEPLAESAHLFLIHRSKVAMSLMAQRAQNRKPRKAWWRFWS